MYGLHALDDSNCAIVLLVATARMKYFSFNEQNANGNDITEMVRSSFEG